MDYFCVVCDKTIKLKSTNNHQISVTHIQYEKCIRTYHTFKQLNFFDIDKLFNSYITENNKKFDLYLVKCDFKLDFKKDFEPHINADFFHINSIFNPCSYLVF